MFVGGWVELQGGGGGGADTGVDGSDSSGSRQEVGDGPRVRNVGGRNLGLRYAERTKEKKRQEGAGGRREAAGVGGKGRKC